MGLSSKKQELLNCDEAAATRCVGWAVAGAPDAAENESTETQRQEDELDSEEASMTGGDTVEEGATSAANSSTGLPDHGEADSSSTTQDDPQPTKATPGTLCWQHQQ